MLVPSAFPQSSLIEFGASAKTFRYSGFKEQLYLDATVAYRRACLNALAADQGAPQAQQSAPPGCEPELMRLVRHPSVRLLLAAPDDCSRTPPACFVATNHPELHKD